MTITPKQTGGGFEPSADSPDRERNHNKALIVGIVSGVVIGTFGLAAAALFIYYRRKKQVVGIVSSSESSMSDFADRPDKPAFPRPPGTTCNKGNKRPVDPRMDPFRDELYARSVSDGSVLTLRDCYDYSRRIQHSMALERRAIIFPAGLTQDGALGV